jgi:tryptophan synthase alpha chain
MARKTTAQVLRERKNSGEGSLVGYFPAGYPTLEDSVEAAVTMCENGVAVLELGVPYSDPVMDGPVIQDATLTALSAGFKLSQVFEAVKQITSRVDTPVLVMTYWNPVIQYGVERFAADLEAAGGAGLITPDLIPDEAKDWLDASEKHNLDRVFLAAPTSTPERFATAAKLSRGFVYAVSTMGITGARKELDQLARGVVQGVRTADADQLTCVGIGISTPDQVSEVNEYSDGAIVGSAFVKAYAEGGIAALKHKVQELASKLGR